MIRFYFSEFEKKNLEANFQLSFFLELGNFFQLNILSTVKKTALINFVKQFPVEQEFSSHDNCPRLFVFM